MTSKVYESAAAAVAASPSRHDATSAKVRTIPANGNATARLTLALDPDQTLQLIRRMSEGLMQQVQRGQTPTFEIPYRLEGTVWVNVERFGRIAREVGAFFMVDMAHYAGLVAAGVYPNPVPHADLVTSTTHKSLRGPRGGIILTNNEDLAKKINSAIFPGMQGGPLMHVIAAKAVSFLEAQKPEFVAYQRQVIANADVLAKRLTERGLRIVSGGTQSHVMLVDLRAKGLTGKAAEALLGEAHMTCNKNAIPNDPEKPMVTSGIRLGTPALTTRGFKETETRQTADLIADVLDAPGSAEVLARVRSQVTELTGRFPVYG